VTVIDANRSHYILKKSIYKDSEPLISVKYMYLSTLSHGIVFS